MPEPIGLLERHTVVSMRMIIARLMTAVVIAATVLLGASAPASACSCAMRERADAFAQSNVVFIGEIDEIRRPGGLFFWKQEARYIFNVDTVFKGDAFERQSVVTHSDGATCGLEISGPGRFLMFTTTSAQGGPAPGAGELASSLCSGNALMGPGFTPDEFGDGFAPLVGSSPTGVSTTAWIGIATAGLLALAAGLILRQRVLRRRPTSQLT